MFDRVKQIQLCGLVALMLPLAALTARPAQAAGGAQIVDDSEVVTPGTCQLETWVTRFDPGDGYLNLAPACTMEKLPTLEIGAAFQHYWAETIGAPLFGPAIKFNFRPESSGLGVGLAFTGGVNLRSGDLELASLIVPVTIPLDDRVRVNLNAGWSYLRDADYPNAAFYGAQVEAKVGLDVTLMVEAFGRAPGVAGAQIGLRYRPGDGPIDFDLLAGGFFDSVNPRFFTVGVTIRY